MKRKVPRSIATIEAVKLTHAIVIQPPKIDSKKLRRSGCFGLAAGFAGGLGGNGFAGGGVATAVPDAATVTGAGGAGEGAGVGVDSAMVYLLQNWLFSE